MEILLVLFHYMKKTVSCRIPRGEILWDFFFLLPLPLFTLQNLLLLHPVNAIPEQFEPILLYCFPPLSPALISIISLFFFLLFSKNPGVSLGIGEQCFSVFQSF